METTCLECREPITQPTTGRPRLYCSRRCRQAAFRRSRRVAELVPIDHLEPVGRVGAGTLPTPAHPDEQVVRALIDARGLVAGLLRLGREARPALAWRCEAVGKALNEALHRYFEEIE